MRYVFVLLASACCVAGCDGVISPDAIAETSTNVSSGASAAPPVNTAGVSCPSDAPQVRVGSLGLRLDIDFTELTGAISYEIQIDRFSVLNVYERFASLDVPAPAKYAEWYGKPGRYLVKVRTRNCGGYGNWSEAISHALDDSVAPPTSPAPQPPPPPGKNDDDKDKDKQKEKDRNKKDGKDKDKKCTGKKC
jgi:hypothetical protein